MLGTMATNGVTMATFLTAIVAVVSMAATLLVAITTLVVHVATTQY